MARRENTAIFVTRATLACLENPETRRRVMSAPDNERYALALDQCR